MLQSLNGFCSALVLKVLPALLIGTLLLPAAVVAERSLIIIEGADYFGRDLLTLKEVGLDVCQDACLQDTRCRAFTYNQKARWCFLKSDFGELRTFDGAVSGRITEGASGMLDQLARRRAELGFLPGGSNGEYISEADKLVKRIAAGTPFSDGTYDGLLERARTSRDQGQTDTSTRLWMQALQMTPERPDLWRQLAGTALAYKGKDWGRKRMFRTLTTSAAINAYLRSSSEAGRAEALALLGSGLSSRGAYRPAIRANRASLVLRDDLSVRAAYDELMRKHGFRITDHKVSSDAANPRICVRFSDPLDTRKTNLADFVSVSGGANLAVEPEARQICIDGVLHGQRYRIRLRSGLPAGDGEVLERPVDLDVFVRDRSAAVRFLGRAYVLPKGGDAGIPLVSVNTDLVEAAVYRVGDASLTGIVRDGPFLKQLSAGETEQIIEKTGERVWQGVVEVASTLNRDVTTSVPVGRMIQTFAPGAYAMTAKPKDSKTGDTLATQWFVVSDLGLSALTGNDGLHTFVHALSSAGPVAGVGLRLVARNDEELGRSSTDEQGYARFEPGLLRGTGGNRPALLVAEGSDGDYAFLDLSQTPFDLTDRGVDGRPGPGPVDVYLVSERGVYRPGERVHLTALMRDSRADAIAGLPLTFVVLRPDGVEHLREMSKDQGLGARHLAIELRRNAMRGNWRARVYTDPKGKPLAERSFLVEDFDPERLDFELKTAATVLDPAAATAIALDARFLYGAPAADLDASGWVRIQASNSLKAFPGYHFGLHDERFEPISRSTDQARTDAEGKALIQVRLPELPPVTKPLSAAIQVQVSDSGGRPVERSISLPVISADPRLGVKPRFDGAVDEGGNAAFDVIAIGRDAGRMAPRGLRWTISRVQTSFQWYEVDGRWNYEPVHSRTRVASGDLDLNTGEAVRIEARVDWGGYQLEIEDPTGGFLPTSVAFEAGWYVAPAAADTPDLLKVSLDKPRYLVGETAQVRIEPRFPGHALVLVIDDRLISAQAVEVGQDGTTVALPVTADWGAGAYVTAVLLRPMDIAAKRMPSRAIGLAWAGVDPAGRRLLPNIAVADKVSPRGPLEISVNLGDNPASEAYVTLAAVDVGILNLTRYEAPAPDQWYFGQRSLGMQIRDLYGRLIDRMQGVPGTVRSGGGAALGGLEGPPPTEALVAFFSGIQRLDDQGRVTMTMNLPDFNGQVRLMAMAWTADGLGHAVKDVIVRDPVVIQASVPRFLAPDDSSRLLLDLKHMEGPAGAMTLKVGAVGEITIDPAAAAQTLDLGPDARLQLVVPLRAGRPGDHGLDITLTLPDGNALTKTLNLPVRANAPALAHTLLSELPPSAALDLGPDLLGGLVEESGHVLVSVGGAGRLDVPGLVRQLDRYPYGCTEQITSRAMPLLYLNRVALDVGLSGDAEIGPRLQDAVADLLGKQASNGAFGLWGVGSDSLWLDAYVMDFLSRAREQDHQVPERPFGLGLDNLRNKLAYAQDFKKGGEEVAYALYVLARNGRAAIGDLRYFMETKLDDFATPMARAQIGAALAQYGDLPRAGRAFGAARDLLERGKASDDWRSDYGSDLRDGAALLTLAAEAGSTAVDRRALAARVGDWYLAADYTSTQEQAWLLMAAHALNQGADSPRLAVDGEVREGALYLGLSEAQLREAGHTIVNQGSGPVDAMLTVTGVPRVPPPAGGNGYRIERAYYDLDGRRADPATIRQGQRLLVLLTVGTETSRRARLIVNDPLPAGFEIDNPNLLSSGDIKGIPWLDVVNTPVHREFRSNRFIAAVDRHKKASNRFQLAYLVRAVSPGVFAHPPAAVEDMYRPALRAWTGAGQVTVLEE